MNGKTDEDSCMCCAGRSAGLRWMRFGFGRELEFRFGFVGKCVGGRFGEQRVERFGLRICECGFHGFGCCKCGSS